MDASGPFHGEHAPPRKGSVSVRAFVLRFAVAFVLLESFVYLVLWHTRWFTPYAELNTRLTAAFLGLFLEGTHASGAYLVSPSFSILVRPGCDAYQASAVLLAGVVAFPASRRDKWIGAVIGVGCLMVLNLLRLAALLWTGAHHRVHFDLMHLEVLPAVFVAAALFLLFAWAFWARG